MPELIDTPHPNFGNIVLDTLKRDLIHKVSITSCDVPTHLRPDWLSSL